MSAPHVSLPRLALGAILAAGLGLIVGLRVGRPRVAPVSPISAGEADTSPVVLRVGDEVVTLAEFDERWRQLGPVQQSFHGARAQEAGLGSGREHFLDELGDEILLAREARRRGIDQRIDVRAAMRACADRVVSRPLLAREVREGAVPASEVEAWFAAHSDQFGEPAQVQVSEIIVTSAVSGPQDPTPDAATARSRLEAIRLRALAGEDFATLAREASEAPSARYGGYVGWVTAGRLSRAWEETALALRAGEVSALLEVPEGFAIVKALDRREATIPPLDAVRERVLDELLADDVGALQRRYTVFVAELERAEPREARPDLVRQDAPPAESSAPSAVPGPSQE